jgi:Family of unknown function (DUF6079)
MVVTEGKVPFLTQYGLISSKISSYFSQVLQQYHRLIIVPVQYNSKINFQQVAESTNSRYINVNLELSKLLLELTQKQRSLKAERLLKQSTVQEMKKRFEDYLSELAKGKDLSKVRIIIE